MVVAVLLDVLSRVLLKESLNTDSLFSNTDRYWLCGPVRLIVKRVCRCQSVTIRRNRTVTSVTEGHNLHETVPVLNLKWNCGMIG